MGIRLHPQVFRQIANWLPNVRPDNLKGAARLMETGGITVPTLELLHDYACGVAGLDAGSAVMLYVPGGPSGYLLFGNRLLAGTTEHATYTPVRLGDDDEEVAMYLEPAHPGNKYGTHRLESPHGGGCPTPEQQYEASKKYERRFDEALSGYALQFMAPVR